LHDEQESIQRQVKVLEPWGEFRMPSAEELGRLRLWFYAVRRRQMPDVERSELAWQVVSEDNQFAYVVVLAENQPEGMPSSDLDLPRQPLSDLKTRLVDIDEQLEQLQLRRMYLTRWSRLLRQALDEADDELTRQVAKRHMVDRSDVFAIQGWVPQVATDAVRDFAEKRGLALTVEGPDEEESPPTLLKNPRQVEGAQGAVTFYITPDYHAWDPTWVVFFSFSLFFAMIMSDAGYGLLLGVVLGLSWKKLSASSGGRAFRNLLIMLIVSCVAYGVLLGSYFGVDPPDNSLLGRLQLRVGGKSLMDDANRYTMMGIAVGIGILHIALANLITAWQHRGSARSLGALGWVAVLLGGAVLGVGVLEEARPLVDWLSGKLQAPTLAQTLTALGTYIVVVGFVCVFLFSSARPLFSWKPVDHVWRVLDGLQGLTGISKAFGDVLSYLRLFALGLASAQLAVTFNDLAHGMLDIPGLGILLALLIVLVGHTINLMLAIMGGVVHGLRLNCIEFFNWCLTDEGYPFRAFCKKAGS
jgi:V/A-type H+-transporting ATPase subunit I